MLLYSFGSEDSIAILNRKLTNTEISNILFFLNHETTNVHKASGIDYFSQS